MAFLKRLFADPRARLVGRAVVAGLLAGLVSLRAADDPFSKAALYAAGAAALMAAIELVSPLNGLLGLFKQ